MLLSRSSVDMVLVPSGLLVMFGYHLFLLYRVLRRPATTAMGYENQLKERWVASMLQIRSAKDRTLPLGVISSNISAATTLSSISIALASLIGAVVGTATKAPVTDLVYGDVSQSTASVKYICLLVCFLAAFTCFIHSTRYYVHSSFLISTMELDVNLNYVRQSVLRGGYFWALGIRALYFATTLLMWIFGPIPMFACSVCMVLILHLLDSRSPTPGDGVQLAAVKRKPPQEEKRDVMAASVGVKPPSPPNPLLTNPAFSPAIAYHS